MTITVLESSERINNYNLSNGFERLSIIFFNNFWKYWFALVDWNFQSCLSRIFGLKKLNYEDFFSWNHKTICHGWDHVPYWERNVSSFHYSTLAILERKTLVLRYFLHPFVALHSVWNSPKVSLKCSWQKLPN